MKKLKILTSLIVIGLFLHGCEYISDVTIPEISSDPPYAIGRLLVAGTGYAYDYHSIFPFNTIEYNTSTLDESIFVISAGYDDSGVHKVRLIQSGCIECLIGNFAQRLYPNFMYEETIVNASPGDTVKNCLWIAKVLNLNSFASSCPAGSTLIGIEYTWGVYAEDFHGNSIEGTVGTIKYHR